VAVVTEHPDELQDLDAAGCARLLAAAETGRLAVVVDGRPRIVVLNHRPDGADLQFRTAPTALIAQLTTDGGVPAEFEVDGALRVATSGWSVIARGTLGRETDPERAAEARRHLRAWAGGERDVVLRLAVEELTGRRVGRL
jgi:uncharacterized protein